MLLEGEFIQTLRYKLYRLKRALSLTRELFRVYALRFGLLCGFNTLYRTRLNRIHGLVRLSLPGYAHPIYVRGDETDYKVFEEVFVREAYRIEESLKPKLIVDAGANVGYCSVYYANRFPEAKIISIEPESGNFEILKKNVGGYDRIEPIQSALWNRVTVFQTTNEESGAWAFQVEEIEIEGEMSGSRHTTTMNQLISASQTQFVDILKVDIEGAERQLFESHTDWLDKVGKIVIELHDWLVPGCSNSVFRAIERKNFSVDRSGELYVFTNNEYLSS